MSIKQLTRRVALQDSVRNCGQDNITDVTDAKDSLDLLKSSMDGGEEWMKSDASRKSPIHNVSNKYSIT